MMEITKKAGGIALLVIGAATAAVVIAAAPTPLSDRVLVGPVAPVGAGTAQAFVEVGPRGEPTAIGIVLTEAALTGLPSVMNTTSRCFDKDKNGHVVHGECLGDYQTTLELPQNVADLELPFRWATVNWNPEGHLPPAPPVWSAAHFDFHFFMADPSVIESIRPGPCGEFIDCDDFATATRPLADGYQPTDYVDVGAAVPAMGNHLVDVTDPELKDPSLGFSRTFIYGVYDGRLIFLEPMVSHRFLSTRPNACSPVKAPRAWAIAGYYPTQYCVRYDRTAETYRVTLEGLVFRQAT